jgi:LPS export ABC transporter protein LptC
MVHFRKIVQILIALIIVGLSLALAAGMWRGKSQKVKEVAPPETCAPDAEMKLTDMEFTETQQGKRFWTLCASEAKYFQEQQRTALKTVHLTFHLEKDQEIQVESKEGIMYAGTKNIELRDSVRAILPDGYVMTMDRAFYDHQKNLVSSDVPIHISGPGVELEGNTLEYKIPDHVATLSGGVKASLVGAEIKIDGIR